MSNHCLSPLSARELDAIPEKIVPRIVRLKDPALVSPVAIEWIMSGYCEQLLAKNERLQDLLGRFVNRFDDPGCHLCLTQGQRILHSLGALDGQVKNGGITQFLWDYPDLIFSARDSLKALGETELLELYDRVLEKLVGEKGHWIELRNQSAQDPCNFWKPFQESYSLLDLSWFDNAYFEKYGASLMMRIVEYVKSHKEEFIEVCAENVSES